MSPPPPLHTSETGTETLRSSASSPGRPPGFQQDYSSGFFHHLWGWYEATLKHLHLRAQLALLEAREAGAHFGVIAALLIAAMIVAVFAYVFLILTAVFALAEWVDGDFVWLKITAGATALHVLMALVLVLMAKKRLKTGVFEKTQEEFRKDLL